MKIRGTDFVMYQVSDGGRTEHADRILEARATEGVDHAGHQTGTRRGKARPAVNPITAIKLAN